MLKYSASKATMSYEKFLTVIYSLGYIVEVANITQYKQINTTGLYDGVVLNAVEATLFVNHAGVDEKQVEWVNKILNN